jgi:RNA polymerase sigma-70 factor (ECF subfamily)
VLRAQGGSAHAYTELVTRFEGRLYNFLRRRVRSETDAEDLAQEAFVRAWVSLDRYDPRWQFSTWLFTIADRLARTHHRRAHDATPARLEATVDHRSADPARTVAVRDDARSLWAAADRLLGDRQRAALWLRIAEDLPLRDIARILGMTPVAVRVALHRARTALAAHAAAEAPDTPERTPPIAACRPTVTGGLMP